MQNEPNFLDRLAMTSFRQFQANRRNALRSTGPTTAEGKEQSRRNALRHGLTAETLIGALEDAQDYEAFEAAVIADYDAQSAVERELVLRLASVLWRLRRATAIETGLFDMQAREVSDSRGNTRQSPSRGPLTSRLELVAIKKHAESAQEAPATPVPDLAECFMRLANLPNYALDRLNRYEAVLWRQAAQIVFTLHGLSRTKPQERRRSSFFLRAHDMTPD